MSDQRRRSTSKSSRSPSAKRSQSSSKRPTDRTKQSTQVRDHSEEDLASKPPLTPTLKVEDDFTLLRTRRGSSICFQTSPGGSRKSAISRSRSLRVPRNCASQLHTPLETGVGSAAEKATRPSGFSHSLSVPGDAKDILRLRNFSITSKGVVNRGDSFRTKRGDQDVHSLSRSDTPRERGASGADFSRPSSSVTDSLTDSKMGISATSSPSYRVWIMGSAGVGKSSIKQQFMTSEHICQYDNWNDEWVQRIVNVTVNGEEAELDVIECNDSDEKFRLEPPFPEAYIIVYSVTNRRSYLQARYLLSKVETSFGSKAVILVGNKTDLARLRTVTTVEGRALAKERGCKFIETSVAINHHVDELLVGILTQIRIKSKMTEKQRKSQEVQGMKFQGNRQPSQKSKASGIIKRLWKKTCLTGKSCDNLHSL